MTATPPPAWYVDPTDPTGLRYWDGVSWTDQVQPVPPLMAQPDPDAQARLARLSTGLEVMLWLALAVTLADIGVQAWGSRLLSDAANRPEAIELSQMRLYDRLSLAVLLVWLGSFATAGVVWMLWQRRLVARVSNKSGLRSPALQVLSWLVPVISWWFPYQNLAAIRSALPPDPRGPLSPWVVRTWWAAWILSPAVDGVGTMMLRAANRGGESVAVLRLLGRAAEVQLASGVLMILAGGLAIGIVRSLTRQALASD